MLCDVCIHKSELGNVMYGAIAKLWLRGEPLIIGAAVAMGGTNSMPDMAGVVGGLSLGNLVSAGDISTSTLCEVLRSDQSEYIARILERFDPQSAAAQHLRSLSGNNIQDMGRQFTGCGKCPEAAPAMPNSTFTWIKNTQDIATGDWTQTYPWLRP